VTSQRVRHSAHRSLDALLLALLPLAGGCGTIGLLQAECEGVHPPPPEEALAPISSALRYLRETQVQVDQWIPRRTDFAGDWPQCFSIKGDDRFVRDASPFMATFIHHALGLITIENQAALGLSADDIDDARAMREAAIALMLRFEASSDRPDAGTFGFWPPMRFDWLPGDILLERLGSIKGQGPFLRGYRTPINVTFFPPEFAILSDADDTATIYAALFEHARLDNGRSVSTPFERFFEDWRDTGFVPRRNGASWMPEASGAYLTWLAYDDNDQRRLNDVDIVVNANVLFALGLFDRLETPGATDAIQLINAAVEAGAHLSQANELSLYYPDNLALHYCVSRAYREGGVAELDPAVEGLVNELLSSVSAAESGRFFWDRGHADLNTAFAVLTLLNVGHDSEPVPGAIDYLISGQDTDTGSWQAGAFFRGRFDSGVEAVWTSAALTTAIGLEALCRWRLAAIEAGHNG
jgi:hypothetical protein